MSWSPMDAGKTLGTRGSENGRIVLDEEHASGARITLERGGHNAPWSVTCGIYGGFLHTAFATSESEGKSKYNRMKADLEEIIAECDRELRYERMERFANLY